MEKKAFIKAELIDGGVRIQNSGTSLQVFLMMSLLADALKKGQLTNEDDSGNETFKKIIDFILKRPKESAVALIKILEADEDLDSLFKNEKENN